MGLLNALVTNFMHIYNLAFHNLSLLAVHYKIFLWWSTWQPSKPKPATSKQPVSLVSDSAVNRVLLKVSQESARALYLPLVSPQSIRLIEVHGRDTDGCIICSIRVAHILQDSFVALSYVWGTDTPTCKILVNGNSVWVRPNLFSFLSHAADGRDVELVDKEIWIDALCINQIDRSEKQTQIPHMGVIFEEATHVVSWLHGTPLPYSRLDPNGSQSLIQALNKDIKLVGDDDIVIGNLIRLAEHSYWTRLWIVQEMHLAKRLTLYWQGQMIDWPQLQDFLLAFDGTKQEALWKKPDLVDDLHIKWASSSSVRPFLTLLMHCFSTRCQLAESKRSLQRLIVDYESQSCLELFDRVFALLALSSGRTFIPSYTMEPISLLANVMLASKDVLPDLSSVSRIGKMLNIEVDPNVPDPKFRTYYLGTAGSGEKARWHSTERLTGPYKELEICKQCETFDKLHVACLPGTDFFFAYGDRNMSPNKVVSLEYVPRVEVAEIPNGKLRKVLHFGVPCSEIDGMTTVKFEYDRNADKILLKEGWYGLCNLFKAWHINRYTPNLRSKKPSSQSRLQLGTRRRSSMASCRFSVVEPAPD